jgi:hypothetical protein
MIDAISTLSITCAVLNPYWSDEGVVVQTHGDARERARLERCRTGRTRHPGAAAGG